MTTEENIPEIRIKKREEINNEHDRYNISGTNEIKEEEKNSSKLSQEENKEIANLDINSNKNSKNSKENLEEFDNNEEDNKSSFLNSKNYENKNEEEEIEESNEEKNNSNNYLNIKEHFMTTGKFMQIQPHFNIFSKQIENLRDSIYNNTKKCLMYKSSLQHSENLMREKANNIVKDLVEKIFNLKEIFSKSEKEIKNIINETNNEIINEKNILENNKKEINLCENRINKCEGLIGYKLLGKPNYSFMKKTWNTTTNEK